MLKRLGVLGACAAWFWLGPAFALGLGEIQVQSRLEQPLRAYIPIVSANPGELESLTISLAPGEDFTRAGIEQVAYLSSVSFALDTKTGEPRILVTGKGPAREPVLDFLLEVRYSGGTLLREYTVLLDPSTMVAGTAAPQTEPQPTPPAPAAQQSPSEPQSPQTPEQAPPPTEAPRPAPVPPVPTAAAPAPEPAAAPAEKQPVQEPAAAPAAGGKTYGPVAPGETLWRVAEKLRPDASVTMDQVMVAVYEANPDAFEGGMNGLLKGAILKVPSKEGMLALDPATAKARVDAIRGVGPATAASAAAPAPEATPSPVPEQPATEEKATAPATTPEAAAPPAAPGETTAQTPPAAPAENENAAPAAETAQPAPAAPAEQVPEQPAAPVAEQPPAPAAEQPAAPAQAAPAKQPPVETAAPKAPPAPAPAPPPPAGGLPMVPIAAALLVAVLLALLGWSLWRRRRRVPEEPVAPAIAARPVIGYTPSEPAAERKPVTAKAAPKIQAAQPAAGKGGDDADAGAIEELADLERTVTTEPTAPPGKTAQETDFDVTSKFAADTVQINLDSNDPVAEADFHLAYGLYDEAALLLKQAIGKDTKRKALRIKLAETYFAAGKPAEFQDAAEALKPMADPAEWQKIAIMGRQLCPDAALFTGAGEADLGVDLALGEVVSEVPAAAPGEAAAASTAGLDFSLEDFDAAASPAAEPKSEPAADASNVLEFDLSEFDLAKEAESALAPPQAAPTQQSPEAPKLELNLSDFGRPEEPQKPEHSSEGAPATVEVDLGEFDLGDVTAGDGAITSGDETGTKLDLARAYLDMGDNEMARSLLNEVVQQGTVAQKKEAEDLLQRVPA